MTDRYQQFVETPPGRLLSRRLGLPQPAQLRRGEHEPAGPILLGGASGGRLREPAARVLERAEVLTEVDAVADPERRFGALVFDASSIERAEQLREAYDFFHPLMRRPAPSGRLLVLATPPEAAATPLQAVAMRALEGFVRSAGKELRAGATAQLVFVAPEAEANIESTLRFLLSARSAYVSGQVVRIDAAVPDAPDDWARPQAGRDGAHVVCLDVPAQGDDLVAVANRVGGSALQLDITAEHAPAALADHLRERHGGVDAIVNNPGI